MSASAAIADTEQLKGRESPEAFYSRAKINRMALDLASAVATHLPALWTAGMRECSPLSPSTYCFEYASVPRGSSLTHCNANSNGSPSRRDCRAPIALQAAMGGRDEPS